MAQVQLRMVKAQHGMSERLSHNPQRNAMLAARCESRGIAGLLEGRAQPEFAPTADRANTRGRYPGRGKRATIPRHSPDCPRALAAERLARQAELRAEKYAKLAASLTDDLRITRARQRVGWTCAPEAEEESG